LTYNPVVVTAKLLAPLTLCPALLGCRSAPLVDTPLAVKTSPDFESYALYSSLYKDTGTLERGEVVAIAEDVMAGYKEDCAKPVKKEDRMMFDAARAQSKFHSKWERHFDFGHEYLLIPSADKFKAIDCVSEFVYRSPDARNRPECAPYEKVRYVRFLSLPVFNADHTRTLILIDRACGGLCGDGGQQFLRRNRGFWQHEPDSFPMCHWVS
jgi:hypothetical protein